jgi:hypothetical protein
MRQQFDIFMIPFFYMNFNVIMHVIFYRYIFYHHLYIGLD